MGQVSPTEFIGIADKIGMMKPLTEWVLRIACTQSKLWKQAGIQDLRIAVNISPNHFLDSDFVPMIKRVIDETGMNSDELELEVTEGVV